MVGGRHNCQPLKAQGQLNTDFMVAWGFSMGPDDDHVKSTSFYWRCRLDIQNFVVFGVITQCWDIFIVTNTPICICTCRNMKQRMPVTQEIMAFIF